VEKLVGQAVRASGQAGTWTLHQPTQAGQASKSHRSKPASKKEYLNNKATLSVCSLGSMWSEGSTCKGESDEEVEVKAVNYTVQNKRGIF